MVEGSSMSVSVVMPVYNHDPFLWAACESVLSQDYDALELICVDDGSTDGSAAVLQQLRTIWAHDRFRFVTTSNAGAHAAINRGVAMSTGDILMFINSDDYYVADRVRECVRALSGTNRPRYRWAFSAVGFIDEAGEAVSPADHGLSVYSDYMYHVAMGAWAAEILPWHNIVLTSGNLVVGRDLLLDVGPFSDLRLAHDWEMALRLLARCDPVILPKTLYLYRFHGANTYRGMGDAVAAHESALVHRAWRDAVARSQSDASSALPFVSRLRSKRGLKAAWDGA